MKIKLYLRLFWLNPFTRYGFILLLFSITYIVLNFLFEINNLLFSSIIFVINYLSICTLVFCGFGYSSYKEYKLLIIKYKKRKIQIPEHSESIYPCFRIAHKAAYNDIKNNKIWI